MALGLGLAATMIMVLLGARPDGQLTAIASPTSRPAPTTRPTLDRPTAAPITPTPTIDPAKNPELLVVHGWGIRLQRSATVPWQAVEVGFDGNRLGIDGVGDPIPYVLISAPDQTARDLWFGPCSADGCVGPLITISAARKNAGLLTGTTECVDAPPAFVIDCMLSNDVWPRMIAGTTRKELEQSWLAEFGDATVTRTSLGGEPAVLLEKSGGRRTVLAVRGEIVVAVIAQPGWGGTADEAAAAFDTVIGSFRFDDLPAS